MWLPGYVVIIKDRVLPQSQPRHSERSAALFLLCHPERSAAESKDLAFAYTSSFAIPCSIFDIFPFAFSLLLCYSLSLNTDN